MIARAGPAEAAALAAIHHAAFPPGERWGADAMALQLALPGVFALLHPQGGMVMARLAADEAEILTLAVHPHAGTHWVIGGRFKSRRPTRRSARQWRTW